MIKIALFIIVTIIAIAIVYFRGKRERGGDFEFDPKATILAIVMIIGVLVIDSAIVQVPNGQADVVMTNGKLNGRIIGPGISFKMPIIDTTKAMSTFITTMKVDQSQAASSDNQQALIDYVVNYQFRTASLPTIALDFNDNLESGTIEPEVTNVMKSETSKWKALNLTQHRIDIANKIKDDLQKTVGDKYGIDFTLVAITNIAFAKAYQDSAEQTAAAEQTLAREKTNLEIAKVLAQQVEARAQGDAKANALNRASLGNDPRIAQVIYQLAWLNKWDSHLPTVMGGGSLVNLPNQLSGNTP